MEKKKLYGINVGGIWLDRVQPFPYTIYNTCKNCSNKWEEQSTAYAITSQMSNKKYDYCSECYKPDEWPDNSTE